MQFISIVRHSNSNHNFSSLDIFPDLFLELLLQRSPVLIIGTLKHDRKFIPPDTEYRAVLPGVANQLAGALDIKVSFDMS